MMRNQGRIGIVVMFDSKRLFRIIKDKRKPWTDSYFRDAILTENVIPFLRNEENLIGVDEVAFIYL